MKKNKNEAVKNTDSKVKEKKESAGVSNTPSEREICNDNTEGRELPFKKSLYGYSPEEVNSFINELIRTHESTSSFTKRSFHH